VSSDIVNGQAGFRRRARSIFRQSTATLGKSAGFTDITQSSCGLNEGYPAGTGWDFCTGAGSAFGTSGK
jgi:hypothetical protein